MQWYIGRFPEVVFEPFTVAGAFSMPVEANPDTPGGQLRVNETSADIQGNTDRFVLHVFGAQKRLVLGFKEIESQSVA